MKTVTRADLVEAAYQAALGPSRAECEEIVRDTFEAIADALVAGDTVKISRFASWTPKRKGPRVGRNPKRKEEEHIIPEHVVLRFQASGELRDQVAGGPAPPKEFP